MCGGDNHDFSSETFCRTVLENLVGEPFCVFEIFWYRTVFWIRGWRVSRFSVKNILSHSTEKARSGILQSFVISGFRKTLCIRRICHDLFVESFLSHRTKKLRRRTLLCFRIFLESENFMDSRVEGDYKDFLSEVFRRTVPKSFIAEPFCAVFEKISGSDKVYGQ